MENNKLLSSVGRSILLVCLLSGVARGAEGQEQAQEAGENGEVGVVEDERSVSTKDCRIEVNLIKGEKLPSGLRESQLSFRNTGDEPVWEVFVTIDAAPMSYWGNSHGDLAIFPDGQVEMYFTGPVGGVFLRPGQTKLIPVYHDLSESHEVARALCSSEDIFTELRRRAEIGERFGTYAPYAESSLRNLFLSSAGWADILAGSDGRDTKEIGRRYFFSTLAYNSLSTIAGGISMMAVASSGVNSGERGYLAEASFNDAKSAFEDGRLDDAVGLLERVLILEPTNALALNNLAYIMLKRGDPPGAARPFIDQAMEVDPDQPSYQNTMSLLLWGEGKKEEALAMAAKAYLGSKGEIVETGINIIQWGGSLPDLESVVEDTGQKDILASENKPLDEGESSGETGGQVTTADRLPARE